MCNIYKGKWLLGLFRLCVLCFLSCSLYPVNLSSCHLYPWYKCAVWSFWLLSFVPNNTASESMFKQLFTSCSFISQFSFEQTHTCYRFQVSPRWLNEGMKESLKCHLWPLQPLIKPWELGDKINKLGNESSKTGGRWLKKMNQSVFLARIYSAPN